MDILQIVNTIVVTLGLPTIIVSSIFMGKKLNALDTVESDIKEMKPDLKDVRERVAGLEGKTAGLFRNNSPISLTKSGERFLQESGLKEFIDTNKETLLTACDYDQNMKTPYDVQQAAFDFFENFEFPDEINNQLKTYAYNQGVSMSTLRRVAAIYFRDLCLKELNLQAQDISNLGTANT